MSSASGKSFVQAIDSLDQIVKILFCLPVLNLVYAIYRIAKGVDTDDMVMVIVGVIWIFLGTCLTWLIDLICTVCYGEPKFFA